MLMVRLSAVVQQGSIRDLQRSYSGKTETDVRALRYVAVALTIELVAILLLVGVVAVSGPSDAEAAAALAERVGYWLGPAAGFVLCVVGGWYVARDLEAGRVRSGLVLGAAAAGIDVLILVASGAAFQWMLVVSNVGRLIAGALGGWLATRRDGGRAPGVVTSGSGNDS
ncbi:MAG: hypothetical protein KJO65_09700 [Gemmatimonadetes bacterium]|nr:hypothetical protein [Gemmatimonadota bacterium]